MESSNNHSSTELTKIGVLGGGAFGTALAVHCAKKGHEVLLWALEQEVVDAINNEHENTLFLKVIRTWFCFSIALFLIAVINLV